MCWQKAQTHWLTKVLVDAIGEKLMCIWDHEKTSTVEGKKPWNCGFCFCTQRSELRLPSSIPKKVRVKQAMLLLVGEGGCPVAS
jgi:hypothetical protein